jgi:hypothetical protein
VVMMSCSNHESTLTNAGRYGQIDFFSGTYLEFRYQQSG